MLPLAWKWQLGVARVTIVVGILAALAVALVAALDAAVGLNGVLAAVLVWLLTLALAVALLAYRFYRDPERRVPDGDDAILSPADGEVVYVREARGGMLPVSSKLGRDYPLQELTKTPLATDDNIVVGIALSFLDVHVNRAPIGGPGRRQAPLPRPVRIASAPRDGVRERARDARARAGRAPDRGRDDRVAARAPDRDVRAGGRGAGGGSADRDDPLRLAGRRRAAAHGMGWRCS